MTAQVDDHSHIISVNGLQVHYWENNPHSPHTIVMLHGFRSSHHGLLKLAEQFPNHHVIIPDFPGYGRTAELNGKHTIPAYAKVIAGFIKELKLENVTLLGHSLGAMVALAYAAHDSSHLRNLVLISPVQKPNLVAQTGRLYYLIGQVLPAPLNKHWLTSRRLHRPVRRFVTRADDPQIRAEVMSEGERELEDLRPHINVQNYLSLASLDPTIWLKQIKLPTLLVAGNSDAITPLAEVISTYQSPYTTLRVIQGMGHFSPTEIPEELGQTIRLWLEQGTSLKAASFRQSLQPSSPNS